MLFIIIVWLAEYWTQRPVISVKYEAHNDVILLLLQYKIISLRA